VKIIPNFHNFIDALPEDIRNEVGSMTISRKIAIDEPVYRQGDRSNELYQLLEGAVRVCNYTAEGKEVVTGHFRPGDCFGEMGLIDDLPRMNHAIANEPSRVRVLGKPHFKQLYEKHPEISHELNVMFCHRIRLLYALSEDANTLSLIQRLARLLHRMVYSHGVTEADGSLYVRSSHEELGRMLGASRQSVSKELKVLETEGSVENCYGKIYVCNLESLRMKYENLLGQEQLTPSYSGTPVDKIS
jgi:CRP/FNR family transcriptional regulator, cyclic AMP receptor protein